MGSSHLQGVTCEGVVLWPAQRDSPQTLGLSNRTVALHAHESTVPGSPAGSRWERPGQEGRGAVGGPPWPRVGSMKTP